MSTSFLGVTVWSKKVAFPLRKNNHQIFVVVSGVLLQDGWSDPTCTLGDSDHALDVEYNMLVLGFLKWRSQQVSLFIQSWAKLNGEDVQAYIQTTKEFTTWGANSSTSEMESGPDS